MAIVTIVEPPGKLGRPVADPLAGGGVRLEAGRHLEPGGDRRRCVRQDSVHDAAKGDAPFLSVDPGVDHTAENLAQCKNDCFLGIQPVEQDETLAARAALGRLVEFGSPDEIMGRSIKRRRRDVAEP